MTIKTIMIKLGYILGRKDSLGFPVRYDENGKEVPVPAFQNYDWSDVINPITRKQVIKWIDDLESGKFEQTHSILKYTLDGVTCHCCLGVLADTNNLLKVRAEFSEEVSDGHVISEVEYEFGVENGSSAVLGTDSTMDEETYTTKNDGKSYLLPSELQKKYYRLNDETGESFLGIAQEIRKDFNIV